VNFSARGPRRGAGGRDLCGEKLPGLEVLYVRGAGEKAGDRPGAPRRADPLPWASESLRKAQALLEAAGLPRGRTSRCRVYPSDEAAAMVVSRFGRFQLFLRFWDVPDWVVKDIREYGTFQLFLRFWWLDHARMPHIDLMLGFQPFLRFWVMIVIPPAPPQPQVVSTLLEILAAYRGSERM
jgi:hypothetical protein